MVLKEEEEEEQEQKLVLFRSSDPNQLHLVGREGTFSSSFAGRCSSIYNFHS
jgi:hypothetical protein